MIPGLQPSSLSHAAIDNPVDAGRTITLHQKHAKPGTHRRRRFLRAWQSEYGIGIGSADVLACGVDRYWDERRQGGYPEIFELMGDPMTVLHMPASQYPHNRRIGKLAIGTGQRLRHGTGPGQSSLDETLEFRLLHCFRQRRLFGLWCARLTRAGQALGGFTPHCLLHEVDASKRTLIRRTGWSGVGETFAFR